MNDNPKWQPFLDKLPESLHTIIKPELEAWDKGVQQRIQEVHEQYKPYKEFVDNKVDPQIIEQGLDILAQLSNDAGAFVKRVDEVYKLNMFDQVQQPPVGQEEQAPYDYNEDYDGVDITQHPAFKQIATALEAVQTQVQTQAEKDKEAQEQAEYEQYLDELNVKYKDQGGINRELVMAYMSQGLDGDAAVKAYQDQFTQMLAQQTDVLNQTNQNNNGQGQGGDNVAANPPAVMGSSGTPGSGLPDTALVPGAWNTNQTVDAVTEMLRLANEQNS